jgi:hypothetical protein
MTEPEPIEIPPKVFEAMSKSDEFFDLLDGWDQFGPIYEKTFHPRDAFALIKEILPHMPLPRLSRGQHFGVFYFDLGDGWVLDVCLADHRGTRVVIGNEFWAKARVWVPQPGEDKPRDERYVERGMVYMKPRWSE